MPNTASTKVDTAASSNTKAPKQAKQSPPKVAKNLKIATDIAPQSLSNAGNLGYANFSEFTFNPKNLREDLNRPELIAQIKADKGVKIPIVVYPEAYNIDGKKVVLEGNCRLFSLQKLSQDSEYKGSLDLPYIEVPNDIAGSEEKELLFILSMGTSNQRLTALEQARGYSRVIDLMLAKALDTDEEYQSLLAKLATSKTESAKDKAQKLVDVKIKKIRASLLKELEVRTGKTYRYFTLILSVLSEASENQELAEALDSGLLGFGEADRISQLANTSELAPIEVFRLAKKAMLESNQGKITRSTLDSVEVVVKEPEILELVNENYIGVSTAPLVLEQAEKSSFSPTDLVGRALDYGNKIDKETLASAALDLTSDTESLVKDFSNEIKEQETKSPAKKLNSDEKKITKEAITKAKDDIESFLLFLSNLITQKYQDLSPEEIVALSGKLRNIEKVLAD